MEVVVARGGQSIWLHFSVELGVGADQIITAVLNQMHCCFPINRDYIG